MPQNYFTKIPFILCLLCAVFLTYCNKDFELQYVPSLKNDFEIYKNVTENDTVVLVCQGGPIDRLDSKDEINDLLAYFPYTVVMVHQSQTKDPSVLNQFFITNGDAQFLNDTSVQLLNKTISHFKAKGKFVIVFGASFGSFLGLSAIAKAQTKADRYALLIGRLDMEDAFWKLFQNKHYGYFKFHGDRPIGIEQTKYITDKKLWALGALLGNIGQPRYTQELAAMDLSQLIYLHRLQDRVVGPLQKTEIDFLLQKGAQVVGQAGDHSFDETDYAAILEFVRKPIQ